MPFKNFINLNILTYIFKYVMMPLDVSEWYCAQRWNIDFESVQQLFKWLLVSF